mmetsp:Transcript_44772/g.70107  ORF Transcript_44772/g.70107 Transcript_44772/m.70107 type:complete len:105 (-) Transcript_44772:253-567(-)
MLMPDVQAATLEPVNDRFPILRQTLNQIAPIDVGQQLQTDLQGMDAEAGDEHPLSVNLQASEYFTNCLCKSPLYGNFFLTRRFYSIIVGMLYPNQAQSKHSPLR